MRFKFPYRISVRVAEAHTYDFDTLVNFNSALLSSILIRYSSALQILDVSVWTLTVTVAEAISNLAVLQALSITLEELPSHHVSVENQNKAWEVIARSSAWTGRLRSLKIQNAGLYASQLINILENNACCRDLQIINCNAIGRALWDFLGGIWKGQASLRALTISNCGGSVGVGALVIIGKLKGLRLLDLYGCDGVDSKIFNEMNDSLWHIQKAIPPRSPSMAEQDRLEVDSNCSSDEDEELMAFT